MRMPVIGVSSPAAILELVTGSSRSTSMKGTPRSHKRQAIAVPARPWPMMRSGCMGAVVTEIASLAGA